MHHPKLKDEHRFNSSILDENDRAKVEEIERHVTHLFECATDQQLAIIIEIEMHQHIIANPKLSFEQRSLSHKMLVDLMPSDENTIRQNAPKSADVIISHFKFKQEKGYTFSIGADRRLLKISRKGNGPKFSVLYMYESNSNHNPCKFVLYKGKKEHLLGKGNYGEVKLAQSYDQNKWYAIKVQSTICNGNSNLANIDNEVKNLRTFDRLQATNQILNKNKHYAAMHLIHGCDAFDAVNDNIEDSTKLLRILLAIAKELQKFHDKGMIHRDIKFDNCMYDDTNDSCQIIDLQFVLGCQDDETVYQSAFLGTPDYLAPEIKDARQSNGPFPYSKRSDLFAFGIMLQTVAGLQGETASNSAFINLEESFGDDLVQPFNTRPRNLKAFIESAEKLLSVKVKAINNEPLCFSSPKKPALMLEPLVGSSPSKRLFLSPRKG